VINLEVFRANKNAWGQEVLTGISWDLLWVFVGAAFLFIVVHMIYKAAFQPPTLDLTADRNAEN